MVYLAIVLVLIFLYYMMVMPRVIHKPDTKPLHGWLYAHRGLHDNKTDAPENSLPAFRKAVEAGYGVELDVQLTKDEQVVVFHDNDLRRVCGVDAPVNAYTYEELQKFKLFDTNETIPLYTDVLKILDGKVPIIMEIKMVDNKTRVCELTNEIMKNYKGLYCMESFSPYAVLWYKKHENAIVRGQLSAKFRREGDKMNFGKFLVQELLTNFITKPDFVAYSNKGANGMSRCICKDLYKNLSVTWTIKSQEDFDKAYEDFDLFIFEGFLPDKSRAK